MGSEIAQPMKIMAKALLRKVFLGVILIFKRARGYGG
jgi:hypothetical protein